jgi:hypothetical protein
MSTPARTQGPDPRVPDPGQYATFNASPPAQPYPPYYYPPLPPVKKKSRKWQWIGGGAALIVLLAIVGHNDNSTTTSSSTNTTGSWAAPSSQTAVAPAPVTPSAPSGPLSVISRDGTYQVGVDIVPGTYRSAGGPTCYWERLSGLGGTTGEIIANSFGSGPQVVTIASSDAAFKTERCGTWATTSQ